MKGVSGGAEPTQERSDGGDGEGDGGVPTTLPIWSGPWAITPRDQISCAGNPSLRPTGLPKGIEVSYVNLF